MNNIDLEELGKTFMERYDKPTCLFRDGSHQVFWLGTPEDTAFRCNTYLLCDGKDALIIDPGGIDAFDFVLKRTAQVLPPENITGLVLCHQDPDVAGSMVQWLTLCPQAQVITSVRTSVLLPHYGMADYKFYNINEEPVFIFESGAQLRFVESPFLHFPGAFTTFDEQSGFLFSGDIWAAIDMDWHLLVDDFSRHELKMSLFHVDYMASNIAARGFLDRIRGLEITAILPQHGSIIPARHVPKAKHYLETLKCGLDLIYPGLRSR